MKIFNILGKIENHNEKQLNEKGHLTPVSENMLENIAKIRRDGNRNSCTTNITKFMKVQKLFRTVRMRGRNYSVFVCK